MLDVILVVSIVTVSTTDPSSGQPRSLQIPVTVQTSAPAAPTNCQITVTGPTSVRVSWQDNSGTETGFVVNFGTAPGSLVAKPATAANVTFLDVTGLTPDTTYYANVLAAGTPNSSPSNTASGKTQAAPDTVAPIVSARCTRSSNRPSGIVNRSS